jgi:glycosyltransferase involved in cell wall biosynthesis
MQSPRVSIVMAVYNGASVIRTTIDSILNQTLSDFEFIIVDDCSRDDTVAIIESCQDPRIVLIRNSSNAGQTRSLNTGLRAARGEYIARTDAGDISFPRRLEKEAAFLDRHPDVAVVGTSAIRYDEEGRIIDAVHMPVSEKAVRLRLLVTTPVVHISVMMRKNIILQLGGYDDEYYVLADYELWARLVASGRRLANIKEVLAGYMVSSASFGARNAQGRSLDEASAITQKIASHLAGVRITPEQARNIHLVFEFDMQGLPLKDIEAAEKLYAEILSKADASKKDIDHSLLKVHLKCLAGSARQRKDLRGRSLRSVLAKTVPVVLSRNAVHYLHKFYENRVWAARDRIKF